MKWQDLLIWLPSVTVLGIWQLALHVQQTLDCHISKGGVSLPCWWQGVDIQGWVGGGMFFGMLFCLLSAPVAVIVQLAIWMRRFERKQQAERDR